MCRLPLLVGTLLLAIGSTTSAQESRATEAVETRLMPQLVIRGEPVRTSTLAERMRHLRVPGVGIAVIRDGRIEWARSYGLADVEEGRAVTTETLFQAASISKPVAATAALKFVQDGRLSLDEDVNLKLVSWKVPDNQHTAVRPVTLRGLLTHSAGTTVHGFPGYARSEPIPSTLQVLDGAGNTDPIRVDVDPGSQWRYSGGGYTVMQLLLTDVADKPFPQIMRETVLEPFGMSASTYEQPLPESRWSEAATGYRSNGEPVEGKWHVYPEMAAAGLWTTPSDLARYVIQIQMARSGRSNTVLNSEMAQRMLTADANRWGLGPAIQADGSRFGHGGSNEGFRCQFIGFIGEDSGVAIMTNSDSGSELIQEILVTLGDVYGWPGLAPLEKTIAEIDQAVYEELAGRYQFAGVGVITIELENGRLWVRTPDGERVELLPESETQFFVRERGDRVTFVREEGRVVAFLYGRNRVTRIE